MTKEKESHIKEARQKDALEARFGVIKEICLIPEFEAEVRARKKEIDRHTDSLRRQLGECLPYQPSSHVENMGLLDEAIESGAELVRFATAIKASFGLCEHPEDELAIALKESDGNKELMTQDQVEAIQVKVSNLSDPNLKKFIARQEKQRKGYRAISTNYLIKKGAGEAEVRARKKEKEELPF